MRRIAAGEFKAKCLSLMDEIQKTGEEVIITKHGHPVARLLPALKERPQRVWGCREGTIDILDDIVKPTGEDWDVENE